MKEKVERFLSRVVSWANKQDFILGISLVGSYARNTARPDSDVDLVILAARPTKLLADSKWLLEFGEFVSKKHEDYGLVQSVRVLYQNGLEVEYGITTLEWTKTKPIDVETSKVVIDSMRILYDPKNAFKHLQDAINHRDRA